MFKKIRVMTVLVCVFSAAFTASAMNVEVTSEKSGVYEGGEFTPREDSFQGIYSIRENENRIVLEKVIHSDREGRIEDGLSYEIINSMKSEGLSAFTVSPARKGQKIYTAVREGYLGDIEVLVIGENFYEYSIVLGGTFYLESGTVKKQ
ncbi:MAG TPA: hypothetical protein PKZ41_05335 [Candidatus Omnitrophota bacterium]|nr:hypothetical protein [Candidatus Omnitrophota bacterium]